MPKFKVTTTSEVYVELVVEADCPRDALDRVDGTLLGAIVLDEEANVVKPWLDAAKIDVGDEYHLPGVDEVEQVED